MSAKHTPGPWRLDRIPTSWRICDPSEMMARGPRLIAYAPHLARNAEANARLIAAAPDLLEALQGLDEAYCRAGMPLTREERHEDRQRLIAARAAIARATGAAS